MGSKAVVFRRNYLHQFLNYLLLLPFAAGFRALWIIHTNIDLFVYILGLAIVTALIMINNLRPQVRVMDKKILLYLLYSYKPEEHPFEFLLGYKTKGRSGIVLFSYEHNPVTVRLKTKDRRQFVQILKDKAIYEIKKIH